MPTPLDVIWLTPQTSVISTSHVSILYSKHVSTVKMRLAWTKHQEITTDYQRCSDRTKDERVPSILWMRRFTAWACSKGAKQWYHAFVRLSHFCQTDR